MAFCPNCGYPLTARRIDRVEVDHCGRCGGTFLDTGEAEELLGAFASPETWEPSSMTRNLGATRMLCPRDRTPFTGYSVAFAGREVVVDLCSRCGGIWLDPKEGEALRQTVMAASQRADVGMPSRTKGLKKPHAYFFQLLTGMPMEVWNPVRRPARATLALVAVLTAVYLLELALAGTGALSTLAMVPAQVLAGRQLWTLLTSTFLHANLIHLFGNAYMLYIFGDNVEDFLGPKRYLGIYFAAALAGSILQAVTQTEPTIPVLGASGAVAGIMGAYLVLFPRVSLYQVIFFFRIRLSALWYIGLWFALNVLLALTGEVTVAWMAHIAGAVTGALLALAMRARVRLGW